MIIPRDNSLSSNDEESGKELNWQNVNLR
jgi:hypothetical protein